MSDKTQSDNHLYTHPSIPLSTKVWTSLPRTHASAVRIKTTLRLCQTQQLGTAGQLCLSPNSSPLWCVAYLSSSCSDMAPLSAVPLCLQ